MLAFCAAAGTGVLTKHKGGRENTIIHGNMMLLALTLALGGWYVIYEQKSACRSKGFQPTKRFCRAVTPPYSSAER